MNVPIKNIKFVLRLMMFLSFLLITNLTFGNSSSCISLDVKKVGEAIETILEEGETLEEVSGAFFAYAKSLPDDQQAKFLKFIQEDPDGPLSTIQTCKLIGKSDKVTPFVS